MSLRKSYTRRRPESQSNERKNLRNAQATPSTCIQAQVCRAGNEMLIQQENRSCSCVGSKKVVIGHARTGTIPRKLSTRKKDIGNGDPDDVEALKV